MSSVSFRLGAGSPQTLRLAVSTSDSMSSPSFVTPDSFANSVVKHRFSLSPGQVRYVQCEINGELTGPVVRVKKPAASFSFWTASCADTDSNHPVFDRIRELEPDFGIHMGDMHYMDIAVNDPAQFQLGYDRTFTQSRQGHLYRDVPLAYMWDDHDYGPNNSDKTAPGRDSACRVFRRMVPFSDILVEPDETDAVYYSFEVGRVVFLMTDLRAERTPNNATDDASKTMMGAAQKQWFKDTLTDPANEGKVFCWVSTQTFNVYPKNDSWRNFTTERDELSNFFSANDIARRIFIVQGDVHHSGIDAGTSTDFSSAQDAPVPVGQFAPLDQSQNNTVQTDEWSVGYSTDRRGQFGLIEIDDPGGDTITVTMRAMRTTDGNPNPPADTPLEEAFSMVWHADVSED